MDPRYRWPDGRPLAGPFNVPTRPDVEPDPRNRDPEVNTRLPNYDAGVELLQGSRPDGRAIGSDTKGLPAFDPNGRTITLAGPNLPQATPNDVRLPDPRDVPVATPTLPSEP
ncbi:MAG TPA: hypothetical protein VKQ05_12880 [Gemmatimonadales bacterium]|nr:hypothetical protein [Gemmatimonadales bacterium]